MARQGRNSRYYPQYPEYVPVAVRRAKAAAAAKKLSKDGLALQPVIVAGRQIATTWWGAKWNENLERYADYSNRIGRGRSYVRNGSVLDLRITGGNVRALVSGSQPKPYEVVITIAKLDGENWNRLCGETNDLDSLPDLLAGKFSAALQERFFAPGTGLFPSPQEITFSCSCPDWASMCKHVAAVLYGVGNRLDAEPRLLFALRQVTEDELVRHSVGRTARGLLDRAATATGNDVLDEADLGDVFGIELDDAPVIAVQLPPVPTPAVSRPAATTPARSKPAAPAKKATRPAPAKPKPKPGRPASKAAVPPTPMPGVSSPMIDQLVAALPRNRRRLTPAAIAACLPAWSKTQVANTIARAVKTGHLERVETGVYRQPKA